MFTFSITMTEADLRALAQASFEDGDDQLGWWWLLNLVRMRDMQTAKPLLQRR